MSSREVARNQLTFEERAKYFKKNVEEFFTTYKNDGGGEDCIEVCLIREGRRAVVMAEEEINRLQAENERLKDFTSSKCEDCAGCTSWKCDCANIEAQAKAEAYKECIEKVKEEIYSQPHSRSLEASVERARIIKIFDNLLKEMVGEDNA